MENIKSNQIFVNDETTKFMDFMVDLITLNFLILAFYE